MMTCPDCHAPLEVVTASGVQLDRCNGCGGVWLDGRELFNLTRTPLVLADRLRAAAAGASPSERTSPRSGRPLESIALGPDLDAHRCPSTNGLWLSAQVLDRLPSVGIDLTSAALPPLAMARASDARQVEATPPDTPAGPAGGAGGPSTRPPTAPGVGTADRVATDGGATDGGATDDTSPIAWRAIAPGRGLAAGLGRGGGSPLVLPGMATLGGLWLVLGIFLVVSVDLIGLPLRLGVGLAVGIVVLQFLLAPTFMDWLLPRISPLRWVAPGELPAGVGAFMVQLARSQGMKTPRLAIIEDGGPNAFAYGRTPNDARIVISRGAIDLLEPAELETVIAHEVGHARHWDMLVMTLANMVPLIAYYIYRAVVSGDSRKKGAAQIAIGAYVLYVVSRYVALWISRTREYYADRFAGDVTGRPDHLASGLVKIAYGLAAQPRSDRPEEEGKGAPRERGLTETIGALGIFDPGAARAMAVAAFAAAPGGPGPGSLDPDGVKGAMAWDLWNPWARYFELHSTHPLVARRLERLGEHAVQLGRPPFVRFDLERPESYWDEFAVDVAIQLLPVFVFVAGLSAFLLNPRPGVAALSLIGLGLALRARVSHAYPADRFPRMNVASLLRRVKVSGVRGVPCTVAGKVVGRGGHAFIWSEDFVLQDGTGVVFLDYRQPLRIWEFLFGLLRRQDLDDADVVVTGWYRRAPIPYIELNTLETGGRTLRAWVYPLQFYATWVLIIVGAGIALMA